eukprot:gnl/Spiro4/26506_TR13191_c0_g1_i1.p1 gnl/Spiro4/26506_TR13191_c0_g1~~gnl/Spiro4/26506_TR13191_c0_g1_i1.p1  ORF type:complete len:159 (+),score=18.48 gnl/Spiro4/26506_TR13191_c0_g1_i1:102-578(+)
MSLFNCSTRVFVVCFLSSFLLVLGVGHAHTAHHRRSSSGNENSNNNMKCSTQCAASDCDSLNIKYGNYCGVSHTGCAGVAPCDAYDACCQTHDACVGSRGLFDTGCHSALSSCLSVALKRREQSFRPQHSTCTPQRIVDTMTQGMEIASAFSGLFAPK